jgi:hypothetical protein
MKTIIYFLFWIPAFAGMTMLISCSDNSVNPPNNGGPPATNDSLIFQKDSLVLRSTGVSLLETFFRTSYQDSVRIEFTGLTNIDSSKALFTVSILCTPDTFVVIGNFYSVYETGSASELNKNHNIIYPGTYSNQFCTIFYISINNSFNTEPKYIILKNMKIYRIKY